MITAAGLLAALSLAYTGSEGWSACNYARWMHMMKSMNNDEYASRFRTAAVTSGLYALVGLVATSASTYLLIGVVRMKRSDESGG